jgi:uncharacterized protein YjbI with pentapeptide repeats
MMLPILGVLVVILVFGCSPLNGKEPPPILSAFPYQCNGPFKDKIPSDEVVSKVRIAHEKWLKDPKDPDGQKANFCGAKLSSGKFQKADLKFAGFQMAMLEGANFSGAQLNDAQLQGANLSGANFTHAHLTGTALDDAMLHLAIFKKTHFNKKASLRHAMLYRAQFREVDLREVEGLTQSQINMACLDLHTKLPQGLNRPEPCSETTQN